MLQVHHSVADLDDHAGCTHTDYNTVPARIFHGHRLTFKEIAHRPTFFVPSTRVVSLNHLPQGLHW